MDGSLRTMEGIWEGSVCCVDPEHFPTGMEEGRGHLVVHSVLSPREVQSILRAVDRHGWTVEQGGEREGVYRSVVIDQELKKAVDLRLQNGFARMTGCIPEGPHGRQKWDVEGLNECFRLTRYPAGHRGFPPHHDAPFVRDRQARSTHTALFCLGGEGATTTLYIPKEGGGVLPGETACEEIARRGGLDQGYERVEVRHAVGDCILFEHGVLHEGPPVNGEKVVMRSDVVSETSAPSGDPGEFAQDLFRLAQRFEVEGEKTASTELYQRALSLRRCPPSGSAKQLPPDVVLVIAAYLVTEDMAALACTSRWYHSIITARVRYFSILEETRHADCASPDDPPFLPLSTRVVNPRLTEYHFRSSALNENKEGVLRVAVVGHIMYADHAVNAPLYVAKYDPHTGGVFASSPKQVMWCAYHGTTCRGDYYALRSVARRKLRVTWRELNFGRDDSDSEPETPPDAVLPEPLVGDVGEKFRKSVTPAFIQSRYKEDGTVAQALRVCSVEREGEMTEISCGCFLCRPWEEMNHYPDLKDVTVYKTVLDCKETTYNNLLFTFDRTTFSIEKVHKRAGKAGNKEHYNVEVTRAPPHPLNHASCQVRSGGLPRDPRPYTLSAERVEESVSLQVTTSPNEDGTHTVTVSGMVLRAVL